jgi:VacB/RNase II family 3'-5' exoribonuclease
MPSQNHRSALEAIARRAMIERGFEPDWPARAHEELARLGDQPVAGLRDLRGLPWSSIDNDDSRDLDQLEVCVQDDRGDPRLLIAIADVATLVRKGSALDDHARTNTTSVYTPVVIFPMLPVELSTDRTSLNPDVDRAAIVVDMRVDERGEVSASDVYSAVVRNHAKLTYEAVAAWLDGHGAAPDGIAASPGLEAQLRLQDRIALQLRGRREDDGALDFDRAELKPVVADGEVRELKTVEANRARDIIESFMIAANGAAAAFLVSRGFASIRRVVRTPERWSRIVDLAAAHDVGLPAEPDAKALQAFLQTQRESEDFGDLSLSVIKLLGRGEYVAEDAAGGSTSHFALAATNYTHSTAPNRRFPDLITQRLIKAALDRQGPPYSLSELTQLAEHCSRQENAANKVERHVRKAAAALWLSGRIGEQFDAVVTGASSKGTWVRLAHPPVEGRLEHGYEGLDVGDRVRVKLVHTDPERGFIDFSRTATRSRANHSRGRSV